MVIFPLQLGDLFSFANLFQSLSLNEEASTKYFKIHFFFCSRRVYFLAYIPENSNERVVIST